MPTLEEMQDAKAYPLKRKAPNPGMSWAEFARKVDKQTPKKPPCEGDRRTTGPIHCKEIVSILKKHGPLKSGEIAPLTSLSTTSVNQYLATLIASGRVVDCGKRRGRTYRVPE